MSNMNYKELQAMLRCQRDEFNVTLDCKLSASYDTLMQEVHSHMNGQYCSVPFAGSNVLGECFKCCGIDNTSEEETQEDAQPVTVPTPSDSAVFDTLEAMIEQSGLSERFRLYRGYKPSIWAIINKSTGAFVIESQNPDDLRKWINAQLLKAEMPIPEIASLELAEPATPGQQVIKVSTDPAFRLEVAEAIVTMAHPGYSTEYQGSYYADPVEGRVYFRHGHVAWNPWSDDDDQFIVSVNDLVTWHGNNFTDTVDWNLADIPYDEMLAAFVEAEGDENELDGDIPDWVTREDVIAFARDDERWTELIEQVEADASEVTLQFALSEIKDEIVISDIYESELT